MSDANNVWMLLARGNKNLSVSPVDLRFFNDKFIGKLMSENIEYPPLEIFGKSKKLRDFVGWMDKAPLVSERAKRLIENLCQDAVQFIKFYDIKGKPYYVMNVVSVVDALDLKKCDADYDEDGQVVNIYRYAFKQGLARALPPIFKEPFCLDNIFVTEPFAKLLVEHQLTGAALSDPCINQLEAIVDGSNPNVVEGIIT